MRRNTQLNISPTHLSFILFSTDLVTKNDDLSVDPASHTRNSSTTSQFSKGSGYESQNSQPILNGPSLVNVTEKEKGGLGPCVTGGHSRQSSSGGDSNYGRYGTIH